MYFERWLNPLWVDSAWALWASCFFRFFSFFFRLTDKEKDVAERGSDNHEDDPNASNRDQDKQKDKKHAYFN